MKKRNAILEETMKEAYSMKTIKCKCGCNETYVRKNEEEFRKTNLKHLISQRDKLINDVEHLKGKVEREEQYIITMMKIVMMDTTATQQEGNHQQC